MKGKVEAGGEGAADRRVQSNRHLPDGCGCNTVSVCTPAIVLALFFSRTEPENGMRTMREFTTGGVTRRKMGTKMLSSYRQNGMRTREITTRGVTRREMGTKMLHINACFHVLALSTR